MKKGHFGGSTPPPPVDESSNAPEAGSSSDDAVGTEDVVGSKRPHHPPPEVPKGEAPPAAPATPKLSIPPQHQHQLTQSPFGAGLPPPSAATMVPLAPAPPPKPQASKSALSNLKLQIPDAVMKASGTRLTCCTECGMRAQRTFGECSRCFGISVSAAYLGLRLLLAVPLGLAVGAAVLALQLLLFLALLLLLPLAALFGLLMPAENETRASPMALPSRHVVILGGGEGLTREIALECVRRGADVTVLAAESDALTATYELMKTISLERQTLSHSHLERQTQVSGARAAAVLRASAHHGVLTSPRRRASNASSCAARRSSSQMGRWPASSGCRTCSRSSAESTASCATRRSSCSRCPVV